MKRKGNKVLDTASSHPREERKDHAIREKNKKIVSEGSPVETKITRRYMSDDLDERFIEEV